MKRINLEDIKKRNWGDYKNIQDVIDALVAKCEKLQRVVDILGTISLQDIQRLKDDSTSKDGKTIIHGVTICKIQQAIKEIK